MEFDKVVLESKKYQDLVKLAKDHNVYRRYAPKAELIERLMDLNKKASENDENNLLSDVSMPSLDISEDESVGVSPPSLRNKNVKADESGMASRSALKEVQVNSPAPQKRRKTVAFVTPEQYSSAKKASSTKCVVRVSTPAKPIKTPVVKSIRKSAMATSTPAPATRSTRKAHQSVANKLEDTFTIEDTDSSPTATFRREGTFEIIKSDSERGYFRREGTFEIITVDNNGEKVSEVLDANGEPASSLNGSSSHYKRSLCPSFSTSVSESELTTSASLSVKELRRIFEPEIETSKKETHTAHSQSNVSPQVYQPTRASRQRESLRKSDVRPSNISLQPQSTRASRLRESVRKSDIRPGNISLPSTARKAYINNRGRAAGYLKPPSTKNLSLCKTPKLKSPSVAKEIQLKQQAASAKKMMEATSANKSRIPPPRKVPNFGEMHAKMVSKMESLVEAKQKVLDRAQEYGNSAIPRCAVKTPNPFSGVKIFTKEERPADSRPLAARKLKLPEKSKIPGRGKDIVDFTFSVGNLPLSETQKTETKTVVRRKESPRKLMPANRLISRLPVFQSAQTTRRSGNPFNLSTKVPMQVETVKVSVRTQKVKETIITKAPVKKVQDITNKNRNILRNVRTNKRFELQMQHRMKSYA